MNQSANYFIAKSEPSSYSIDDLQNETVTVWDGVKNYQAINVIKSWKIGDLVFFYRSVTNPAIVGLMKVITFPIKDENDSRGISWHAKLEFVEKFNNEISLKAIKSNPQFSDLPLVRQSRLSTMACHSNLVKYILQNKD